MTTTTLIIPGTPPSYNMLQHAHWRANHRVKGEWESWFQIALLEAKVPKGLQRIDAAALLLFRAMRRRDEGNFRVVLEKALGDTLTGGGWLPDDTPDHYRFGRVRFGRADSSPQTEVTLTYEEVSR